MKWFRKGENTLCVAGYPLRIVKPGPCNAPFGLEQDGKCTIPYWTLVGAKMDAEYRVLEINEFERDG